MHRHVGLCVTLCSLKFGTLDYIDISNFILPHLSSIYFQMSQ